MLISVRKGLFTPSDWGLTLDKGAWVVAGLLSLAILAALLSSDATGFGFGNVKDSTCSALRISSTEILIRALLVSSLLARFGEDKNKALVLIMLSALIITLVRMPEGGMTGKELALSAMIQTTLGYFYYVSGSVVITMFFPIFPGESVVADFHNPLIAMALYFALALVAKYVSPTEAVTETEIAASDTT